MNKYLAFLDQLKFRQLAMLVICMSFLILQIPFLEADPDFHISTSRGANTDEGLYSCQIRNYINHGDICFDKSDGLLKTPLLNAFYYPVFKLFGTHLIVARLALLLISTLLFYCLVIRSKFLTLLGTIFMSIVMMQYHIFHFSHFALAEFLSSMSIGVGLLYFASNRDENSILRTSMLSSIAISCAYLLKIQFLYSLALLPLIGFMFVIFDASNRKVHWKRLAFVILFTLIIFLFFIFTWYLPNKELFEYVMADQTDGRWVKMDNVESWLQYVFGKYFHNTKLIFFSCLFYFSVIIGLIRLYFSANKTFKFIFSSLLIWGLLETHKLFISYLPTRYLVSTIVAMGLIISCVMVEGLLRKQKDLQTKVSRWIIIGLILVGLLININSYTNSLTNRSFQIKETNQYLEKFDFGQGDSRKPILGAWAPSLSWSSKAFSLPIWDGYFDKPNALLISNAAIVVSETEQGDSNQAYLKRGIDLDILTDSVRSVHINNWELKLYWLKNTRIE